MDMKLTEQEIQIILDRRERIANAKAYNEGLYDAYNLVSGLPASETRTEIMEKIKSLQRDYK